MKRAVLALLASVILAGPALALDFNQKIKSFDNQDLLDANGKPVVITLGVVVENSLLSAPAANEDEKKENFWLAVDLHNHMKDFTPTPKQVTRIDKALAATQGTAIYGLAMRLIDPTFMPVPK